MTLTAIVDSIIGKVNTATGHIASSSNPHSVTKTQVGLGNVDNTSDANKPISTATQTALNLKANQTTTYTKLEVDAAIAGLVDSAPVALDTLNELAAALGDDANFSTTVTNSIATKAPLNSPTFTGTVSGITATMVGLGNVNNTSDANKPVSTAQATAIGLKQNTLVSGTNIKTVNSTTLLGSGDIVIPAGATGPTGPTGPTGATGATGPAGTTVWSGITGKPTTLSGYGITDAPTNTGTGASGTWGINVTGSSASCTGNSATASNSSLLSSISAVNLYNNMGQIHGTSTAFDPQGSALTRDFGYRYVQGTTNAHNVGNLGNNQYYSWSIGLGSDYNYNQYGMQFAIPRNATTPYLSVRYEEGGVLGAWQKLSSGYSDTSGSSASCTGNAATATNVAWSGITSKPTTISGYGITDAAAQKATASVYGGAKMSLSGSTLTITTT